MLYQGERRVGGKTAMLSATGEVVAEFNVTRPAAASKEKRAFGGLVASQAAQRASILIPHSTQWTERPAAGVEHFGQTIETTLCHPPRTPRAPFALASDGRGLAAIRVVARK